MSKKVSRRGFLARTTSAVSTTVLLKSKLTAAPPDRPNILWITSEDNGPHLGAYGDTFANTENLDRLAEKGTIYLNAWSNAPVCAPARTAIITGMHPPSTGAEHMRSMVTLPEGFQLFPRFLRSAGYYCTNNSKEDYNVEKPGTVWDESSNQAHWRKRDPSQPFFSVFNLTITHESQIRTRPHEFVHDPDQVPIPAYHPDTPEVRQDWAQYYDRMAEMDRQAGEILRQLEEDGLAEDTIVFYYGDHGPGMPRSKRWPYNSGLQVPLIVYLPERFRHLAPPDYSTGGRSQRLVSFVDLAPTVLRLAGLEPPSYMQGSPFLGPETGPEPAYIYGYRGRMDERYDLVRSVRNHRYVYIRNYMPHKIYGQYLDYMFQTPTTRVWNELFQEGKLHPPQTFFWEEKPVEELYDLEADPDEVSNLADSPAYQSQLHELREALQNFCREIRDVGFLPEDEIHSRSRDRTPYETGHDPALPLARIIDTAELASDRRQPATGELLEALADADSAVRYWGLMGLLIRGEETAASLEGQVEPLLEDPSPSVRVLAGTMLAAYGSDANKRRARRSLLELSDQAQNGLFVALLALNGISDISESLDSEDIARLRQLPKENPQVHSRMSTYVTRLIDRILSQVA
ncbi:MAG TPA: sulfatase-like hydrolase/transferase [Acidobacteriota bacterium]|nr:sulfatase-like hydrolase/transferase [Acidobacteriota bacterium]